MSAFPRRAVWGGDSPATYAVIDPGSATLRVLAVAVSDGQSVVWGWGEGQGGAGGALPAAFEQAFAQSQSAAEFSGAGWSRPEHMVVGLPGSQLRARALPVTQRRARADIPVQERELVALLSRGMRLAANRLAPPPPGGAGWMLMECAAVALTVDGRGVTDPVGFRGEELGATLFAALAPVEAVGLWRTLAELHGFSTLTLTAAPLALASCLPEPQGLLLDVGGGTTDLTWCRANRPVVLGSVAVGGWSLTSSLLHRWDLAPEKAEYLKRAYAAGDLADQARAQVLEAMSPALQAWLDQTERALVEMSADENRSLPSRVYLMGGGSTVPEMLAAARALAWSRRLRFARYPQTERLLPAAVPGVVNRSSLGSGAGDVTALALASWIRSHGPAQSRSDQILAQLCDRQRG